MISDLEMSSGVVMFSVLWTGLGSSNVMLNFMVISLA